MGGLKMTNRQRQCTMFETTHLTFYRFFPQVHLQFESSIEISHITTSMFSERLATQVGRKSEPWDT